MCVFLTVCELILYVVNQVPKKPIVQTLHKSKAGEVGRCLNQL